MLIQATKDLELPLFLVAIGIRLILQQGKKKSGRDESFNRNICRARAVNEHPPLRTHVVCTVLTDFENRWCMKKMGKKCRGCTYSLSMIHDSLDHIKRKY
jgi:hypothetical protein